MEFWICKPSEPRLSFHQDRLVHYSSSWRTSASWASLFCNRLGLLGLSSATSQLLKRLLYVDTYRYVTAGEDEWWLLKKVQELAWLVMLNSLQCCLVGDHSPRLPSGINKPESVQVTWHFPVFGVSIIWKFALTSLSIYSSCWILAPVHWAQAIVSTWDSVR